MNHERQAFNEKVKAMPKAGSGGEGERASGGNKTTIEHHPDGSHTVNHADGDKTGPHAHLGEAMMHIHSKHMDGPGGHLHVKPEGGATTHHTDGMGTVGGPDEHDSAEAAGSHLGSVTGGDGDPDAGREGMEAAQSISHSGASELY